MQWTLGDRQCCGLMRVPAFPFRTRFRRPANAVRTLLGCCRTAVRSQACRSVPPLSKLHERRCCAQGAAPEGAPSSDAGGGGALEPLPAFPDPDFPAEIRDIMRKLRFSRQEVRVADASGPTIRARI